MQHDGNVWHVQMFTLRCLLNLRTHTHPSNPAGEACVCVCKKEHTHTRKAPTTRPHASPQWVARIKTATRNTA